jgi:hypothetical protein
MTRGQNTGIVLADSGSSNVGISGLIAIAIVLIIFSAIAVSVTSYFRLQRHRADAVAHAAYRKLAEEALQMQDQVLVEIKALGLKVSEIEHLLRSVE